MKAYLEDFCHHRAADDQADVPGAAGEALQVGDPGFRIPVSRELEAHMDRLRAEGRAGNG